jgi:hypothetical protein
MHPGLRALARLQRQAWRRRVLRSLRSPRGLVSALLILGLLGLWVGGAFLQAPLLDGSTDAGLRRQLAGVMLSALLLIAVVNGIAHRGVYLPPEELERLLSAPVPRADLVRYRLSRMLVRGLPFAAILGALLARNMPSPAHAWLPAALAILLIPIVAQLLALALSVSDGLASRLAARVPRGILRLLLLPVLIGIPLILTEARELFPAGALDGDRMRELLDHRLVRWGTLPLAPFTWAMAAVTTSAAVMRTAACAGVLAALYELTVRLPVDFREVSIETSRDLAQRIARVRSGSGGVAAMGADSGAARRRMGWWAGRGPFGALVWLRSTELLRRAGRVVYVALLQLALAVFLGTVLVQDHAGGAVLVLALSTYHLSTTIRADLRADLDRIQEVKAWPLPASQTFLASVLPGALVAGLLVSGALVLRAALAGGVREIDLVLAVAAPVLALVWGCVENLSFLVAPVRFTPGEVGTLQSMGRVMLHSLANLAVVGLVVAPAVGVSLGTARLLGEGALAQLAGLGAACAFALGLVGALSLLGGRALRRLDPSRVMA